MAISVGDGLESFHVDSRLDFTYRVWCGGCLNQVKGDWKLLYSTISILGSKRTKLGLRDFINLGDFVQIIDVDQVCCVKLSLNDKFSSSSPHYLEAKLDSYF